MAAVAVEPEPVAAQAMVASSNGHAEVHAHTNGKLQANLWEAAKIVAEAATAPAAVIEPSPAPVPIQLAVAPAVHTPAPPAMANGSAAHAGLTPAVPPLPVIPPPPTQDESTNYNIPAFIAASKGSMDKAKWVLFGSTAAFLGVILAAIWYAAK
jgi:hypothetical protein